MENNSKSNIQPILLSFEEIQSGLNSLTEIISKKGSKLSQKVIKNLNCLSIQKDSDEWSENLERICLYAEHEIDFRFESIKQELDNLVDNKIDKYLYKKIYRSIKKGQKLHKVYKVN